MCDAHSDIKPPLPYDLAHDARSSRRGSAVIKPDIVSVLPSSTPRKGTLPLDPELSISGQSGRAAHRDPVAKTHALLGGRTRVRERRCRSFMAFRRLGPG